jgi:hypothetical protein
MEEINPLGKPQRLPKSEVRMKRDRDIRFRHQGVCYCAQRLVPSPVRVHDSAFFRNSVSPRHSSRRSLTVRCLAD